MPITPKGLEIYDVSGNPAVVMSNDYDHGVTQTDGIQEAVDVLPTDGGIVLIPPGEHIISLATGVILRDNITVNLLKGSVVKLADSIDADGVVFQNSDQVNGNSNIHIIGEGIIDGNEYNQTAGRQFGISFMNVTNSSIDIFIRRCRTSDWKIIDSAGDWHNKRFYPEEIIISDFEGNAEWTVETGTAVRDATQFAEGYYSWKLTPTGGTPTVRISKAIALDLSSHYISLKLRTSDRLHSFVHMYIRFYAGARYFEGHFYRAFASDPIPWNVNEWMNYTFSRSDFVKTNGALEADWESIDAVKIELTSDAAGNDTYLDDFKAIRCVNEGVLSVTFDDGVLSQYDTAFPLMSQYDYRGTIFVICRVIQNGTPTYLSVDDALAMAAAGWDISSHTWSHPLAPALDGLSDANVITELIWPKEWLIKKRIGNIGAMFFAYPGGGINSIAQHVYVLSRIGELHQGVENIGQVIPWFIRSKSPADLATAKDYVDKCIKYHNWTILYFHAPDAWFSDLMDYLHDNGVKVMSWGQVYQKYKDLLRVDTIQNPDYGDAVDTPSNIVVGVNDVYGTETRIHSLRGRIVSPKLKITVGGVVGGTETITVKIITWWDNEGSITLELSFNAIGTYWLNNDNWLALWQAVTYTQACRYFKIYAKSDQAVTNATVATDVIA